MSSTVSKQLNPFSFSCSLAFVGEGSATFDIFFFHSHFIHPVQICAVHNYSLVVVHCDNKLYSTQKRKAPLEKWITTMSSWLWIPTLMLATRDSSSFVVRSNFAVVILSSLLRERMNFSLNRFPHLQTSSSRSSRVSPSFSLECQDELIW